MQIAATRCPRCTRCPDCTQSLPLPSLPLWQRQFPGYRLGDMPAIPAGWIDTSWHNDAAPSFQVATGPMGEPVQIWIDHPDPAQREVPGIARFLLTRRGPEDDMEEIHAGEDWNAALEHASRERLACAFARGLIQELTPAQWRAMRLVNRINADFVCASHDHCDANMVMLAAWEAERAPMLTPAQRATGIGQDIEHANAAWTIAKAHYLTASEEGDRFDIWRMSGVHVASLIGAGCELGTEAAHDRAGRVYRCGFIEAHGERWAVTIGNDSRIFEHLVDAEAHVWRGHAAIESA